MNKIVCLVGSSCAGKTTLAALLDKVTGRGRVVTSYTTRQKRPKEVEGVDYYFVSKEEFGTKDLVERVEYDQNFYGLADDAVRKCMGDDYKRWAIVVCDINGVRRLKERYGSDNIVPVYISISEQTFSDRLTHSRSPEDVKRRVAHAKKTNELVKPEEIEYVVENNGTIGYALRELKRVIKRAFDNC